MSKEIYLSNIEREILHLESLKRRDIKMLLFDLDDTICRTGPIFRQHYDLVADLLYKNNPLFSPPEWRKKIVSASDQDFLTSGVSPSRFITVSNVLASQYNLSRNLEDQMVQTFEKIYHTPVKYLPGAKEGLEFVSKLNIPRGVVTHANVKWTERKYEWINLNNYFDWDNIFIVDENGQKTEESWKEAARFFKTDPSQCAVYGNSPKHDINPAWKAGIRHCSLIKDPNLWTLYDEEVPKETKKIKDLSQILDEGIDYLPRFTPRKITSLGSNLLRSSKLTCAKINQDV